MPHAMPDPSSRDRRRIAPLLCALLALLPVACRAVHVTGHPGFAVAPRSTYAWSSLGLARLDSVVGEDPALESDTVRELTERELARHDLHAAPADEADYMLVLGLGVEQRLVENDPYFTARVAEQLEEARLHLVLRERTGDRRSWRGETSQRLRTVSTSLGGAGPGLHFTPTGQPRDWDLEGMLARVLERLPRDG